MTIRGAALTGIHFAPETPSAQVKSAVLLAGLQASGETRVVEPACTRDHTERALAAFGATVTISGRAIALEGGQRLTGQTVRVPGDISSAAFMAVAAAAMPGSDVTILDVGLNPVARRADRRAAPRRRRHRDRGRSRLERRAGRAHPHPATRRLRDVVIAPEQVPELIDELPVLATLGTFGGSVTVSGAGELRFKESDRIAELVAGLRAMGADAEERPDGFQVRRGTPLTGGAVHAHGDHRLAMAFAIAALGASGPTQIDGADAVAVSYPSFFDDLDRLAVRSPAGARPRA